MELKKIGVKNSQFIAWKNNLYGIRLNNIAQEQGWSSYLTVLLITVRENCP